MPLGQTYHPAPLEDPESFRKPHVERGEDPDVKAARDAAKKRLYALVGVLLAALALPVGYITKGLSESWTEARKAEDAAAKARREKFAELAAKLDVKPATEEGVVEALVARVAKCEAAAAKAVELEAKHEKLESRFYGYIEATGARVRRTDDMAEPASVKITPAPRSPRRSVLAPKPEVRFPPPEQKP